MIHLLWASLAIPIIIHLVYRRKAKPMWFSTLRFLRLVDQRVTRSQRLKELLLLALRLLLLAALIGALERRVLPTSRLGGRGVPTCAAIILDDTCSMRATQQDGTAYERARAAALTVLDGLGGEDTVALVPFDAPPGETVEPTSALGEVRKKVAEADCGYATASVAAPLRLALDSLSRSIQRRKEMYIITDMQKLSWTQDVRNLKDQIPPDLQIFLVNVGQDVGRNLALEDVNFGLKVVVRDSVTGAYCTVRNTGAVTAEAKLALVVEGRRVAEQKVSVAPGAAAVAVLHHVFDRMGMHSGYLELGADELPADNRRYFTVDVRDRLPVLIVNGAPSAVPYLDGAFYLRLALEAGTGRGASLSPVQPKVIAPQEFASTPLSDYACVLLADVAQVRPEWPERLAAYVRNGGGLLIFCGSRVDPASYNAALGSQGPTGPAMLPAHLRDVITAQDPQRPYFPIAGFAAQHPIFRDISAELTWETTQVKTFFRTDFGRESKDAAALLSASEGALLLERRFGSGVVMLCTTGCTTDWNNLPLKKSFLPLLHEMVYYVSRSSSETLSVPVGMAYRMRIPQAAAAVPVKFFPPEPEDKAGGAAPPQVYAVQSAVERGENTAVFRNTGVPGVYRAEALAGEGAVRTMFAVNVPVVESNLERIAPQDAAAMVGAGKINIVAEPQKLAAAARRAREGLPLWDYLLLATLLLAVAESLVGNVLLKH